MRHAREPGGTAARRARLTGSLMLLMALVAAGAAAPVVAEDPVVAEETGDRSRADVVATRGNTAFDSMRARSDLAMGRAAVTVVDGRERALLGGPVGDRLILLDADLTRRLIAQGWAVPRDLADGWASGSERMRALVGIARALKLPPAVGVMQASFGTSQETRIAQQVREVEAARAQAAKRPRDRALARRLEEARRALEGMVAALPKGPRPEWVTADLDVNRDGLVDALDLAVAEERRKADARRLASKAPAKRRTEARSLAAAAATLDQKAE
jgi:hypothetical protein